MFERKRRRYEPYHRIPNAYDRRHALVTLHAEGWNVKSIAGSMGVDWLKVLRVPVYASRVGWGGITGEQMSLLPDIVMNETGRRS